MSENSQAWTTGPISPTCQVLRALKGPEFCDLPTSYAYPAAGGGWMALCFKHGQKHLPHCSSIEDLIRRGETFDGSADDDLFTCENCNAKVAEVVWSSDGAPLCARCAEQL